MRNKMSMEGFEARIKNEKIELIFNDPSGGKKFFSIKKSRDGLKFLNMREHFKICSILGVCESPKNILEMATSKFSEKHFFLTYAKKKNSIFSLYGAVSKDGYLWKKTGLIKNIHSFGMAVPEYTFEKQYVLYFGKGSIRLAWSSDLTKWHVSPKTALRPRKSRFDRSSLKIVRVLTMDEGIVIFYSAEDEHKKLCLGAALFDKEAPEKVLWRSEHPLWKQMDKNRSSKIKIIGIIPTKNKFIAYFQAEDGNIFFESIRSGTANEISNLPKKSKSAKKPKVEHPKLTRSHKNPILAPRQENAWEAVATFNPAALNLDNKIHLIYRAIGTDGKSQFGYASSNDGLTFDERLTYPAYTDRSSKAVRDQSFYSHAIYPSGGSWGGCEDPRMVEIEGRVYVTFNMFDDWALRVGLVSISKEDFIAKHFHKWDGPHILSHGNRDKNWVLFPEKIRGKFAVLHSIIGDTDDRIRIEYIDDLKKISKKRFKSPDPQKVPDRSIAWHTHIRSAGPPPVKTEKGWLLFYHANDSETHKYKVGVMLLDLEDPTKIIARANMPVLEPDFTYENHGKPGIVYAAGAVIRDGELHLYYGGADKVVCVATAPVDRFVDQLISSGETTMTAINLK